jgi:hypothetical protein
VYGKSDTYNNPLAVNISTFVPISENVLFACIGGIDHSATLESGYHNYRIFGLKYLSEYWIRGTKIWYFDLQYDLWGRDLTFEITEMNYSCYYYAPISFHSSNITLINLRTNQKRKYESLASDLVVTLEDWFITNLQTLVIMTTVRVTQNITYFDLKHTVWVTYKIGYLERDMSSVFIESFLVFVINFILLFIPGFVLYKKFNNSKTVFLMMFVVMTLVLTAITMIPLTFGILMLIIEVIIIFLMYMRKGGID